MNIDAFKNMLDIVYEISLIILTILIAIYAIKTYHNEKKLPPKIRCRVNYSFINKKHNVILVNLDILNYGDFHIDNVKINLKIGKEAERELDYIEFINSKEIYNYFLGEVKETNLKLFNGENYTIANPYDCDYFEISINEKKNEKTNKIENIVLLKIITVQSNKNQDNK